MSKINRFLLQKTGIPGKVLAVAFLAALAFQVTWGQAVYDPLLGRLRKSDASEETGSGDVIGPTSTTANKVPQWDTASKTLKDGLTVGTAASNLVQLDGSAKLPAVDGSALTGVTATDSSKVPKSDYFAKGVILSATAANTESGLAVGTNGHVLTADSTEALGVKWAAPSGGVTGFDSALNTASPNNSNNVSSLTASGGSTNQFAALVPKGTGGIIAAIPNSAAGGGNIRGDYSVDLQINRPTGSQVANGAYAVITGGEKNTSSGTLSTVCGGSSNTSSSTGSTIAGGANNASSNNYTTVAGGNNNNASGQYASIGGGTGNTTAGNYSTVSGGTGNSASVSAATVSGGSSNSATSNYSTVAGGESNTASTATHATVVGGKSNTASGIYSGVTNGLSNTASGSASKAGGYYESYAIRKKLRILGVAGPVAGYCQYGTMNLSAATTSTTTTELLTFNADGLSLAAEDEFFCRIMLTGTQTDGSMGAWESWVCIKRIVDATSLEGVVTTVQYQLNANLGTPAWTIAADDTNDRLAISITAGNNTATRWHAVISIQKSTTKGD